MTQENQKKAKTNKKDSSKARQLLTMLTPISKSIKSTEDFNKKLAKLGVLAHSNSTK